MLYHITKLYKFQYRLDRSSQELQLVLLLSAAHNSLSIKVVKFSNFEKEEFIRHYLCHTSNCGPTKTVLSFKRCETKKQ